MAKRRWTVVLVPHDSEPSRILEVSYNALKGIGGAIGGVVALMLVVGFVTVSNSIDLTRTAQLQQENADLAAQLDELNSRLTLLADTLDQIAKRDERIRILANLEPIDPQVKAAGIGGPTLGTSAVSEQPLERRASGLRVDLNALIRRANLLASSFREARDSLKLQAKRLAATPSILPTQGWLSSSFSTSRMHPLLHIARRHEGIDISAHKGTPIVAPAAGVVRSTGWRNGFGYVVVIDHGFGIETWYAHTSKILVHRGQRVVRGERIALVGSTGLATAPHLHYEVHVNGRPVNPMRYVLPESIDG